MTVSVPVHRPDTVLVRRAFQQKSAKHAPWVFLALLMTMAAVFVWLMLFKYEGDFWEAARKLYENNPGRLVEILAGLAVTVLYPWIFYVQSRDRIVIDSAGISFQTPVPSWFPEIIRGWVLPWSRIRGVDIRLPMGTSQLILVITDGAGGHKKILIDAWILSGEEPRKPTLRDVFRYQKTPRVGTLEELKTRAEAAPLVQALRANNVAIHYPEAVGTGLMFDLQSNLRTKLVVVVLLGLLFYATLDTFFISEVYVHVDNLQWTIWVAAGLVVALLVRRWTTDSRIPRQVSIGLGIMTGASVGLALYPGLLRLNQLTDSNGLTPHDYVLREYVRLVPVHGGLPEIRFGRYPDYWNQFQLGSVQQLYLRRGGLGFYQLDETPLHDAIRAYYEKKNAEARESRSH